MNNFARGRPKDFQRNSFGRNEHRGGDANTLTCKLVEFGGAMLVPRDANVLKALSCRNLSEIGLLNYSKIWIDIRRFQVSGR